MSTAVANKKSNAADSEPLSDIDQLRKELAINRAMAENSPINILLADTDLVITYANPASLKTLKTIEHLLPVKIEQIVGQSIDLFHEDPTYQRRLLAKDKNLPHRAVISLGEEKLDLLVSPTYDDEGTYLGPMVTWEIVTEKLRLQRAAAEKSALVENVPINIMLATPDLKISYINPASLRTLKTIEHLLPIKADQVVGQSIDIFHKDPSHQRGILSNPKSLPRKAHIKLGAETLDLLVSATYDDQGNYMGPMVTWEVITTRLQLEKDKVESDADNASIKAMLTGLSGAQTVEEAVGIALSSVKDALGWAYSSFWTLDPKENILKFSQESGSVNEEFRRATMSARFREGEGLSGRAWKNRDLYFVENLADVKDCCRAPAATRAGVKSGVCFPVVVRGNVVGTMDFFTTETLTLSSTRADSLRSTSRLISQSLERIMDANDLREKVDQLLEVVNAAARGDLTEEITVNGTDAVG